MSTIGGTPDSNFKPTLSVIDSTTKIPFPVEGNEATGAIFIEPLSGFTLPQYDYVSMTLSNGDATETYTFKVGGSGGTTVATIVIVYTDSTRDVISTVTKT